MVSSNRYAELSDEQLQLIDAACDEFEQALVANKAVSIEQFLGDATEELRSPLFRELLSIDLEFRRSQENVPEIDDYLTRFPERDQEIQFVFLQTPMQTHGEAVTESGSGSNSGAGESFGTVIGAYTLRELIGEGGMGLVYVAQQEVPVRRNVALKLIKPGMDTKEVIARFEAERQALALMHHPNIAQVFDAGVTENHRPYFVMELIRGLPITEFCNKHTLDMDSRLQLFSQICLAVQHAHQKGIIHRDIKPSNLLVTLSGETPIPKVIDFGVAKATNQRLTERTIYTRMSQLVGTPLYMSPEQAEQAAEDVDTRTDVYSLGVVLYELLTGTTPFTKEQLSSVGFDEMRRMIRDDEPPLPSRRLSSLDAITQSRISRHLGSSQPRLMQQMRGELDWIVMKAIEKNLARRYASASDFAADIRRYLADEEVLACPPSAAYRLRKFARRNKVALAGAVFVSLGLLAGIVGLAVSNVLIRQERNDAEVARNEEQKQRQRADENLLRAREAVNRYFTLVSEGTLLNEPGLQPLRKDLIENATDFYQSWVDRGDAAPEVIIELAKIRLRLGTLYSLLTSYDDALAQFEQALDGIESVLAQIPADSHEFAALAGFYPGSRWAPGAVAWSASDQQRYRDVMARGAALWKQFVAAHSNVAAFRTELFFWTADVKLLQQLVDQFPNDRELLAQLAIVTFNDGNHREDPIAMRDAIAMLIEADLPIHRDILAIQHHDLGWRLMTRDQNAEAAVELRKSVNIFRELANEFPHIHNYGLNLDSYTSDLARALANSGQRAEAEKLATNISPRSASEFVMRGNIYKELGDVEKAIFDYDKALELGLIGQLPNIGRVGNFLDRHKQHEKAILFYNHGIATNTTMTASRIYADRGASWANLNRYDKALADFTKSIEINASDCEHHLSRLSPRLLREASAEFQASYLELANRAIEISDGTGQSYLARSYVYLMLGQREKAKSDLARGVELEPYFSLRFELRPLLKELQGK